MSLTSESPITSSLLLLFKSDLQDRQNQLSSAIDRAHKEIQALPDSEPGDVIDKSCGNASKEAVFTTYSRHRIQLRKVEAALLRLSTGDFGTCAGCGGVIGFKRLQALPWANTCIKCQQQSDETRIQ